MAPEPLHSTLIHCDGQEWCYVRCSIYSIVVAITLAASLYLLYRFCKAMKRAPGSKLMSRWFFIAALGSSAFECFLILLHSLFVLNEAPGFAAYAIKNLATLAIVYFFVRSTCMHSKKTRLISVLVRPCAIFLALYLVVMCIYTVVTAIENSGISCTSTKWIFVSSSGLVITLVFVATALIIRNLLNDLSVSEEIRKGKIRQLLIVVTVFLISTSCAFVYDIVEYAVADGDSSKCDEFLGNSVALNQMITMMIRIIDLLIPLWAILLVVYQDVKRMEMSLASTAGNLYDSNPATPDASRRPSGVPPTYMQYQLRSPLLPNSQGSPNDFSHSYPSPSAVGTPPVMNHIYGRNDAPGSVRSYSPAAMFQAEEPEIVHAYDHTPE